MCNISLLGARGLTLSLSLSLTSDVSKLQMVHATLDNYELNTHAEDDNERGELHHNWVDEVVRCEGRGATVACDASPINMIVRPQPEKKDPSLLTR